VEGAEDLYREIRVENTLEDGAGNPVALKEGPVLIASMPQDRENWKMSESRE
jgi:hypothetical protein